jgi:predicted ferric reductase
MNKAKQNESNLDPSLTERTQIWNIHLVENGLWYSIVLLFFCAVSWFFAYGVRYVIVDLRPSGILRYAGSIARGMGFACTFCSLVLPLTINRTLATVLYRTPLYDLLCVERWIPDMHTIVGTSLAATGWIHGIAQIVNYAASVFVFRGGLFTGPAALPATMLFVTGVVLMVLLVPLLGFGVETVRRKWFRLFWWTHRPIAVLVYICLIFHGLRGGRPWTVYFFAGPVFLYIIDRLYQLSRATATPRRILVLSLAQANSNIVKLSVERRNAVYLPGQYFKIMIIDTRKGCGMPADAWHPFTAASAPSCDSDRITFYIAAVGKWTRRLHSLAEAAVAEAATTTADGLDLAPERICMTTIEAYRVLLAGPYGAPAQSHLHFPYQLLIGSGVGATPMVSILREICSARVPGKLAGIADASDDDIRGIRAGTQHGTLDTLSKQETSAQLLDRIRKSGILSMYMKERVGIFQTETRIDRLRAFVLSSLWLFSLLWMLYISLTIYVIANAFDANVALVADFTSSAVLLFLFSFTIASDMLVTLDPPRWRYVGTPRGFVSMSVCGLLVADLVVGATLFGIEQHSSHYVDSAGNAMRIIALVLFCIKSIMFALTLRIFYLPRPWRIQLRRVRHLGRKASVLLSRRGNGHGTAVAQQRCVQSDDKVSQAEQQEQQEQQEQRLYANVFSLTFVWVVREYADLWGIQGLFDLAQSWTPDLIPRVRVHIFLTRGEIPASILEAGQSTKSILQFHQGRPRFETFIEDLLDLRDPYEFERLFGNIIQVKQFNRVSGFSNDVQRGIFFCGNPALGASVRRAMHKVQRQPERLGTKKPILFIQERF